MFLCLDSEIKEINTFVVDRPLGDRMKEYEGLTRFKISKEYPMIIRLDGNAFHTFTRGFMKPFDTVLRESMEETAKYLAENIPGTQMVYTQSDEISILVTNYQKSNTNAWFDNNLNKITSITASMATLAFNRIFRGKSFKTEGVDGKLFIARKAAIQKGAMFDSRAFLLPKDEVVNYFIWRQQDAIKNSISMVAQSLFSHKSLQGLNGKDMIKRMKDEKAVVYEKEFTNAEKRGSVVHRLEPEEHTKEITLKDGSSKTITFKRSKWDIENFIPIFRENKGYINKYI